MTVRTPVPPVHDGCPKCAAGNTERKFYVWVVSDERGTHYECDVCAHQWQPER